MSGAFRQDELKKCPFCNGPAFIFKHDEIED